MLVEISVGNSGYPLFISVGSIKFVPVLNLSQPFSSVFKFFSFILRFLMMYNIILRKVKETDFYDLLLLLASSLSRGLEGEAVLQVELRWS